jgi:hypothetical protein
VSFVDNGDVSAEDGNFLIRLLPPPHLPAGTLYETKPALQALVQFYAMAA